jgi:hypothetical protein
MMERADVARLLCWGGVSFFGFFLVPLINLVPMRWNEPTWQLSVITILMSNGIWALLGTLLMCLAQITRDPFPRAWAGEAQPSRGRQ